MQYGGTETADQAPTGGKIDFSKTDPIPFKKTATLVNYFIINTAQFLNS
jgi:hypothetical protein